MEYKDLSGSQAQITHLKFQRLQNKYKDFIGLMGRQNTRMTFLYRFEVTLLKRFAAPGKLSHYLTKRYD